MSIRKKTKEELELLSYTDIAYEIIKEDNKQYNTPNLFKEVCSLLNLSEEEFEKKIGDFFTALTTDKRFILIDSVNWDLKENHVVKVVVDDSEDEDEEVEESEEELDEEENDESMEDIDETYNEDMDELEDDDDLEDLTIVDEEELEE